MFPTLSPDAQAKIGAFYQKGYLTREDVFNVVDITLDDRIGGQPVPTQPSQMFGDDEGVGKSGWMLREFSGELASYKSKDQFENVLTQHNFSWEKTSSRESRYLAVLCPFCPGALDR